MLCGGVGSGTDIDTPCDLSKGTVLARFSCNPWSSRMLSMFDTCPVGRE